MRDLYARLKRLGYDHEWVRAAVLPDWWDDELARVPFDRASAECAIAGHLSIPVRLLQDPKAELPPYDVSQVCFKRNTRLEAGRVGPALQVVRRAAELVATRLSEMPQFAAGKTAGQVRSELLAKSPIVTLDALVDYCWGSGIAVVSVPGLPKNAAKFDGVAMFVGHRPVIVLASGKDAPAYLAYHLAHELGHLMRKDVKPGEPAIVDDGNADAADECEQAANAFGLELLTGDPGGMQFTPAPLTAGPLGRRAADWTRAQAPTVDPGVVILNYCKSAARWAVAKGALEAIGQYHGGHSVVAARLARQVDLTSLMEFEARFLVATCRLPVGDRG